MLLYRLGPEGFYAATDDLTGETRILHSDPFETPAGGWELGRPVEAQQGLMAPVVPGKIVGVGRNFPEHVEELGNEMPVEPVLFLKAPSSIIGPNAPVVLPPESEQVEYEGEIAVVVKHHLRRAGPEEARAAVLGVTCACDVTARDLQRRDPTFARAKSFDTFCPLGPAVLVDPDFEALEIVTRVNGDERQRKRSAEMIWGIIELLVYVSRMMSLAPGDVMLTGTPAGVGPLVDGDQLEVEVSGVGTLRNPVQKWRQA